MPGNTFIDFKSNELPSTELSQHLLRHITDDGNEKLTKIVPINVGNKKNFQKVINYRHRFRGKTTDLNLVGNRLAGGLTERIEEILAESLSSHEDYQPVPENSQIVMPVEEPKQISPLDERAEKLKTFLIYGGCGFLIGHISMRILKVLSLDFALLLALLDLGKEMGLIPYSWRDALSPIKEYLAPLYSTTSSFLDRIYLVPGFAAGLLLGAAVA